MLWIMGYTLLGMPPPSSGGAAMILILNILASYNEPLDDKQGTPGTHRMIEAFKRAYAISMGIGEPDFCRCHRHNRRYVSPRFAAFLQTRIDDNRTSIQITISQGGAS